MKIGAFSDSQIGHHFTATDARGVNQRMLDLIDTFKHAVYEMIEKKCDLILFAGDMFRSNQPSVYMQIEVARILCEATEKARIVLLPGNHDIAGEAFGYFPLMDLYKILMGESKISVIGRPEQLVFGNVQICGIPYPNKGMLGSDDIKGLSNEDINLKMREYIAGIVKSFKPKPDKYSILMAHLAVQEAKIRKGLVLLADDVVMGLKEMMTNPPFDATLLGHYHKQQILSEKPFVAYLGSIDCEDFGEEGQQKKYLIIDTDLRGKPGEFEWHSIHGKRFITVKMDPKKEFHIDNPKGALVRLRFGAPADAYKMNIAAVVSDLYKEGAQEVFVVYDYEDETQLRNDTIHKNMSEVELLAEWLKLQNEDVKKRSKNLMEKIKEIATEQ